MNRRAIKSTHNYEVQLSWDARDQHGAAVASGVYLTRLRYAGGMQQTRPLLHLK